MKFTLVCSLDPFCLLYITYLCASQIHSLYLYKMRFRHDIASQVVFFSLLSSLTHILGGFQLLYHLVFTVLPCISFTWAALPFYLVGTLFFNIYYSKFKHFLYFFVKLDFEIAVDQKTRTGDQTFGGGVPDSDRPPVPAGQPNPYLVQI